MKWTFTSDQVANGGVQYSLEEFRRDLYQEVLDNFPDYSKDKLDGMFRLAYDVCYCEATQGTLAGMVSHYQEKGLPVDMKYLELIRDSNRDNCAMLKAVLARELAKHMQSGLSNEEALQRFDEHIKKVAARMPAPG
jgi:hypothetical protein